MCQWIYLRGRSTGAHGSVNRKAQEQPAQPDRPDQPDQLDQPNQVQCMAFAESDATHPTETPGAVWKATSGLDCSEDEKDFELVESVSVTTGTVRASLFAAVVFGQDACGDI